MMNMGQALPMDDAKKKLANLEEHMPGAIDPLVYEFARYLSEHLNPQLVPMGFVMACELALSDLATGKDGRGNPIRNGAVGYPPQIYGLLRLNIPQITDAVFPTAFADGVKNFLEEVNRKMK
jgi:hypothetical protein